MAKKPKAANQSLTKAKEAKQDEFYTQLTDIEKELRHYKKHFRGKVVYCNCDDPKVSNFFKYFLLNFEQLGLKRLIATCYKNDDANSRSKGVSKRAVCLEYDGVGTKAVGTRPLEGDGDFRSEECVALLKQADIVVTNPPFSLFREYVAQLVEHGKKFLIIGNINAITYKECFGLIKTNKMWLGYNCTRYFVRPDGSLFETARTFWYTNLDIKKRHEDLILYKKYTPKEYPTYDNYDAIEVGRAEHIPVDYYGAMGVPITFLDKYNPDQFEIVGTTDRGGDGNLEHLKKEHTRWDAPVVAGKGLYKRIIIKRRPQ